MQRFAVVSVVMQGMLGCSLLSVVPAPKDHEQRVFVDCTTQNYAPAIDVASSAGGVAGTVGLALQETHVLAIVGAGLAAAAFAGSAAYGYLGTDACRDARALAWERQHVPIGESKALRVSAFKRASTPETISASRAADTTCKRTGDCGDGYMCDAGKCIPLPEHAVCRQDSDCIDGYGCKRGMCKERPAQAPQSTAPAPD